MTKGHAPTDPPMTPTYIHALAWRNKTITTEGRPRLAKSWPLHARCRRGGLPPALGRHDQRPRGLRIRVLPLAL